MDRFVYTAMSGANALLQRQEVVANNIANASTTGFRAQMQAFVPAPVDGAGLPTRVQTLEASVGNDFTPGVIQTTGRPLDVAIRGSGWIAVEGPDGREAYTRNGAVEVDSTGTLRLQTGQAVQGDGGPLVAPPDSDVAIAPDGSVTATPLTGAKTPVTVGRIKLVDPPAEQIARGDDGLFRLKTGEDADADPNVTLATGALEGSNVNAAHEMVSMIALARQFEMQMKLLTTAEGDAKSASQLLSVQG